jgi:ABC-2 type transport system permease protein
MNSLRRIWAVAFKELRHLLRDRMTLGMVVMMPIVELVLFGYAINTDVRHISASVYDQAQSSQSRELVASLVATQVLDIDTAAASIAELEQQLTAGIVSVGVYIPADVERRLQQPDRPSVQLLVDGSDPMLAAAVAQLRSLPVTGRYQPPAWQPVTEIDTRIFYNPEMRSVVNTVPGIVGIILTMTMILFTAIALVRERERGNLELLIITPVTSMQLMLGKVAPYVVIGLLQVSLILGSGVLLFAVPMNGSLVDVYLASLLFVVACLTIGLLISTAAQTQLQSMQMMMFVMLPSILLSGFMFPFSAMPKPAQWLAEVLPMTHFNRLMRGIILRGAELGQLWPEMLALAIIATITLLLAVTRFHKHLD